MEKWADYLISAVRYAPKRTHIEKVKEHEDNGDNVGTEQIVTRKAVIDKIKIGYSYVTIFKSEGKWQKGNEVGIVMVEGEEYIRTDRNKKKVDNLENLPEF